ncbi:hypothetical protein [Escherichia coli]|uniref:Uncharacterized protein n=5 Tax=Escherichia coli TaxID=562 RepID=A0A2S1JB52_ECOLX|nr:hypothetical protein [Escherichia coli]AWF75578.1 hypothetical protein FOBECEAA_00017 [Escherichia coli]MCD9335389.1 hypothetical protein [Escherichia coli]MCV5695167.1 hypothetical protein [Escherichia coli]MCV5734805.1 hypothetical protein [Escherichia coli]MCV5743095.1 hypothetical protein [Escherichia coli]
MSLTLPIMYFKTGSDLSQITHFEVNYPDDFVKQAWERPEINLFIVCVATKKGAVREIKGGMAVLTSIPASNGLELSRALDDVLRKSDELRPLAGQKNNVFLPAKVGLAGDPPTEQELLSLFGVSLDIENYCTLRLFFDLSTLAGLSRRNLPEAGIRLLFQI